MNGERLQQFHKALLSAFPTPGELKRMVSFKLDENLDAIAGGGNYLEVVSNLIEWAKAQGRLEKLLTAAREHNPGNPDLRRFQENETKRMAPLNINQILSNIHAEAKELESIIIFDLREGFPLYFSSEKSQLHYALIGDNDIGPGLKDFENINQVQKALDSFGKATKFGELNYSIFKLNHGQLMVYFYKLPDTVVAICFIAFNSITLGTLVSLGRTHIQKIKDNIPGQ